MSKRGKRKKALISQYDLVPSSCPSCNHALEAVTAAQICEPGMPFQRNVKLKGHPTLCTYCGAVLIFADDAGRVRAMTEAERNALELHPDAERVFNEWRRDYVRPAEDYTKKTWN